MIIELVKKDSSRKLYEETFNDSKEFVDYYYSEKCSDNRIVANVEEGEVMSMLHLNPYYIRLGGEVFKSYYVVAVATDKNRRHEGQMARAFAAAMDILRREKVSFIFLMPIDEAIYSWMGFEKICDFSKERITDYDYIVKNYDMYCIRDDAYIRRMKIEDELRAQEDRDNVKDEADASDNDGGMPHNDEGMPEDPIIMAKIIDLDAFNAVTGNAFEDDRQALEWLRNKKIYICEEV